MPDSRVGPFHVAVDIANRAGGPFRGVNALVDTGATYTWIPRDVLTSIGVQAIEEWPFILADGREVAYPVAWIQLTLEGRTQPTIVVFGEPESEARQARLPASPIRSAVDSLDLGILGHDHTRLGVRPRRRAFQGIAQPPALN